MKLLLRLFLLFGWVHFSFAQKVWMYPNKGQWDDRILYNLPLSSGRVYIENEGLTFFLSNATHHDHQAAEHDDKDHDELGQYQCIKHIFKHGQNAHFEAKDSSSHYHNYFIGNDPSDWKSGVRGYTSIIDPNYFEDGKLIYLTENNQLSFHLELAAQGDISQFAFQIQGADSVWIDAHGNLRLQHRFGEISYSKPLAWNINANGDKLEVPIHWTSKNGQIDFILGEGYDPSLALYIDPSLTFSTFTGSPVDNWGFTATPDVNGNLFGGGIVFGSGYPTTVGAFDASYNAGTGSFPMDVSITKFNATGTALLYSTYLGGSGNETPHSIVCAPNGELFVYGVTSSTNFPMAGSSYDNSFNGGPYQLQNSLEFNGSDIYIARFNAAGTSLLASTYVGGSSTDGLNSASLFEL